MIKKGFKYVCQFCLLLFISIGLLSFSKPQKVNADHFLTAPFIGFNLNVIDYDVNFKQTKYSTSSVSSSLKFTEPTQTFTCTDGNASTGYCNVYKANVTTTAPSTTNAITLNLNTNITNTEYYHRLYEVEFILDNDYVGYVTMSFVTTRGNGESNTYFVNGRSFKASFLNENQFTDDITQVTIFDYELVANNSYHWVFPIESFNIANSFFADGYQQVGINQYNNYLYPIFTVPQNSHIYTTQFSNNITYSFVFCIDKTVNTVSAFNNLFSFNKTGITIDGVSLINRFIANNVPYYYVKVDFKQSSGSTMFGVELSYTGQEAKIMPVYFGAANNQYISTDFAILNGLSNKIIDYLNIMANGTTQSNSTVSSANTTNNELSQSMNQELQFSENVEQNMQDDLDNLDIQNQNNNLFSNTKFFKSAQWVTQRFNFFTTNNAYGYLITFSLVVGLALVIIGKLRG